MTFYMMLFEGLCLAAFVFCMNETIVNGATRREALGYVWKWLGILSPAWMLVLLVLYAIVAGECTTGGYDPVHFPDWGVW